MPKEPIKLTPLQRKIYEFIKLNRTARYRTIMDVTGLKGVGSVQAVIAALSKKGLISERRRPGVWVVFNKPVK